MAWSDAARKAAAEARRLHGAHKTLDRKTAPPKIGSKAWARESAALRLVNRMPGWQEKDRVSALRMSKKGWNNFQLAHHFGIPENDVPKLLAKARKLGGK